ncbi:hypothetical protein D5H75_17685 [Bailinhaonella thermotolerans]|uniref:Uncharacterized protein n=1 Tax=Bailinhaonella thermotolerans TaxID=1070861 RepID=A0A3A4AVC6_9ACTN|nr:hypothetical protein D5H75_17685 [Bailinhaonella thermotolerans]
MRPRYRPPTPCPRPHPHQPPNPPTHQTFPCRGWGSRGAGFLLGWGLWGGWGCGLWGDLGDGGRERGA